MGADVQGVDQLVASLDVAAAALEGLPGDDVGRQLVAQADTPVHTGALAATVTYMASPGVVALVAGSATVDYAGAVHKVNPWLARTIETNRQAALDTVTEAATDAVSQVRGA